MSLPFIMINQGPTLHNLYRSNVHMGLTINRRVGVLSAGSYTNKQTQHDMFLASNYYRDFLEANPEYAESKFGVGYTVWMEALSEVASFVSNPKDKSCADQKISSLENLMLSLYKVIRYPRVKENLKNTTQKITNLPTMSCTQYFERLEHSNSYIGYAALRLLSLPFIMINQSPTLQNVYRSNVHMGLTIKRRIGVMSAGLLN